MKFDSKLLQKDEQIIKTFRPMSIINSVLYYFDKRTTLIITNKRIMFRTFLGIFDKEIIYNDIGAIIKRDNGFEVLKKGEDPGVGAEKYYQPFMSCSWFSKDQVNEFYSLVENKVYAK